MTETSAEHPESAGPPGAVKRSLERALIRVRESGATLSTWQMTVDSAAGSGTITLLEVSGAPWYRGEGLFLGWPQQKLAAEYQRLNTPPDEPNFELQQLG